MDMCYAPETKCIVPSIETKNTAVIIRPPKKITRKIYRCDNKFLLDDILEMYKSEINYGVVLVSGDEYRCYVVEITGTHSEFKLLSSNTVALQNHTRRGGMSQNRICRIKTSKDLKYIQEVVNEIIGSYMRKNNTQCIIEKIIIAGPGDRKHEVIEQTMFQQYFASKLARTITTPEIKDDTIRNVFSSCGDIFKTNEEIDSTMVMEKIAELIKTSCDKLVFGEVDIYRELKSNMLSTLVISDDLKEDKKAIITELLYDKCKLIVVPLSDLKGFGQLVGIKWFDTENYEEESEIVE
ncbi:MAG: peptide chain release factor 1 eRF1 [Edafosvirus sp.]|uniref:Peptide chain release factor 1 eRF1 n=1 Tax=Edafosvirus sp. TaxID=2487765 RepID=A0A3G4ZWC9_9VIRU|nr:MAG: peptide chain release factor 1 eRF1 [Edafosvirus sp.]